MHAARIELERALSDQLGLWIAVFSRMSVLGWILFGFVVGLVGRALMPERDPIGLITVILIGMAGAVLAGALGYFIGLYPLNDTAGFVAATLGAIVAVASYRLWINRVSRRRREAAGESQKAA